MGAYDAVWLAWHEWARAWRLMSSWKCPRGHSNSDNSLVCLTCLMG